MHVTSVVLAHRSKILHRMHRTHVTSMLLRSGSNLRQFARALDSDSESDSESDSDSDSDP